MGSRYLNGSSYQHFKNDIFLGWVMVRMGMKVSFGVSLFSIDLVGKGAIKLMRNENIQKGKRVIILDFHSKLDVGENVVKMVKERVQ
jgi:hypothetical protein